ncbi:MAG TPA: hypothetical protein VEI51_05995 [Methanomicrobiales archaeon]|nr:hypothetical protein [Methanomicrobiales archaeon]
MDGGTGEIIQIIDEVLSTSTYVASYAYPELMEYADSHAVNGIGVHDENDRKFYIVFEGGAPEGVIFTDSKGTLFGDKAAILLTGQEAFELFQVSQPVVNALASRCRIFDRSHVKKRLDEDLPSFGGIHRSPGILCLTLAREGVPQQGIRVSIKKGRQIIASDITTTDGKVCFKLLNGTYDCTAIDRSQETYTFMVDFNDRYAESVIEIGG